VCGQDWVLDCQEEVADPAPLGKRGDQLPGLHVAVARRGAFGPLAVELETGAEALGFVFVAERHAEEDLPGCSLG
jgi:hypothetical protein